MTTTYNQHGDEAEMAMIQSGSVDPKTPLDDQHFEICYLYQYDSYGNWTEKAVDGTSSTTRLILTYY